MNYLSWLKKKKLPLLPDPSPALNTYFLLSVGLRLSSSRKRLILFASISSVNKQRQWNVIEKFVSMTCAAGLVD